VIGVAGAGTWASDPPPPASSSAAPSDAKPAARRQRRSHVETLMPLVPFLLRSPQRRRAAVRSIQSVLHAPVAMSAGVNRLAAAALNSSCPAGMGRVIQ